MKVLLYSYLIMISSFTFGSSSKELLAQSQRNVEVFLDDLSTLIENKLSEGKLLINKLEQQLDQTHNLSFDERQNYQEQIDCLRKFERNFTYGFNNHYFEVTDVDEGIFEMDSPNSPPTPHAASAAMPRASSSSNLSSIANNQAQSESQITQNSVFYEPPILAAVALASLWPTPTPTPAHKFARSLMVRPRTCPPSLVNCSADIPSPAIKLALNDKNITSAIGHMPALEKGNKLEN